MKSWSQRELALAVLVVFAAPAIPYVTSLGEAGTAPLQQCDAADPVPLRLDLGPGDRDAVFSVGPERPAGLALDFGPDYLPGVALPFEQKSGHRRPSGGGLHRFL